MMFSRVLLEQYLSSSTHDWTELRAMYRKQNRTSSFFEEPKKQGKWETPSRNYWKENDRVKYKSKGKLCEN